MLDVLPRKFDGIKRQSGRLDHAANGLVVTFEPGADRNETRSEMHPHHLCRSGEEHPAILRMQPPGNAEHGRLPI
jgi:hypothetical protein